VLPNDFGSLDASSGVGLYRRMLKPNSVPARSEREAVTSCDAVLAAEVSALRPAETLIDVFSEAVLSSFDAAARLWAGSRRARARPHPSVRCRTTMCADQH
jgi:hypothetical protein